MIKKFIILIFISQLIFSCGFNSTLKELGENNNHFIYYEINPNNSYIARQAFNSIFQNISQDKAKHIVRIDIKENRAAVNVESSGAVNEYRAEILINFEIFSIDNSDILHKSQSRGFANYDVSNSEYENTLIEKEAIKRAITSGFQLMNTIIQSKISN